MRRAIIFGLAFAVLAIGGVAIGMTAAPGSFAATKKVVTGWFDRGAGSNATVEGRVRLSGLPVPYARVELHTASDSHIVQAGPDGSFRLEDVPAGSYQVTIHPPTEQLADPDGGPSHYLDVPDRYRDAATSGLRLELVPGTQSRSLVLSH